MPRSTVRDKIVRTAGELFYGQGYNLTGIDEVIEKADIARGSLYYHFDSKADLLLAWLDAYLANWWSGLEAFLKGIADPKKKLLAIFDYRTGNQERNGFRGCPMIKINDETGTADQRVLDKVRKSKDRLRAFIRDLVEQIGPHALLTTDELTQLIYCMAEGGITSSSIYKNSIDLKKAKKVVAKLI